MRSLYIHIPFCTQKCPYCSFYSTTDTQLIHEYLEACIAEIRSLPKVPFDTVYIGGGTPSYIGGTMLGEFIGKVLDNITYTGGEFTIEVNPDSVDIALCNELAKYPISRISMGVQSLDNSVLSLLGRVHSSAQALMACKLLQRWDLNLDLIYDIPTVPYDTIKDSLQQLISLNPSHISAYSYSPDTGYLAKSASDDPFQMNEIATILERAGYARYEVSNFARKRKQSKHNTNYWQMGDYYGVGAAAHSMINMGAERVRYSHQQSVTDYIKDPLSRVESELLSGETVLKEDIVFGLRMIDGINFVDVEKKYGKISSTLQIKIDSLVNEGMLGWKGKRLMATERGLLLLDSVTSYLW
ncbi:MAG: radical SAM family heme chaperone HemW [Deferribacteraceae bacterium]|jgi:oxygen-independent coproporphyrinogen-3 oxidase|nr:radical SAM family heme chaperone HemW [Deferribacteraceae bacterium]